MVIIFVASTGTAYGLPVVEQFVLNLGAMSYFSGGMSGRRRAGRMSAGRISNGNVREIF